MCPNEGQPRGRIQILKKEMASKRVFLATGNQDTFPNTVQMWEPKVAYEPYHNQSTSLTAKTKLKLGLAESEDLEGPNRKERFVL